MIDLILGALCEVRSVAHQEAHGGLHADSTWHVSRGELPTCGAEGSTAGASSHDEKDQDGKSRYCRKKWFC